MMGRINASIALISMIFISCSLAASAQYSPNCIRNNEKDYCSISTGHYRQKKSIDRFDETIVFADHSTYEVSRIKHSCRQKEILIRSCEATISFNGEQSKASFYIGTSYEGGYKHEYIGDDVHITYYYLD